MKDVTYSEQEESERLMRVLKTAESNPVKAFKQVFATNAASAEYPMPVDAAFAQAMLGLMLKRYSRRRL